MLRRSTWYASLLVALGQGPAVRAQEGAAIDPVWVAKAKTEAKAVLEKYDALASRLEEVDEVRVDKASGPASSIPVHPPLQGYEVLFVSQEDRPFALLFAQLEVALGLCLVVGFRPSCWCRWIALAPGTWSQAVGPNDHGERSDRILDCRLVIGGFADGSGHFIANAVDPTVWF